MKFQAKCGIFGYKQIQITSLQTTPTLQVLGSTNPNLFRQRKFMSDLLPLQLRSILCSWLPADTTLCLLEMVIISKMAPFIHVGGFCWRKQQCLDPTTLRVEYGRAFVRRPSLHCSALPVLMHNVPHQFLFAYTVFHPHMAFCLKLVVKMAALDTKKHIAVGNLTKKGKMSTIRQSKTHCLNKRKRPLHSK